MTGRPLARIGAKSAPAPAPAQRTRYLVRGSIAPRFVEAHALSAPDAIAFVPTGARGARALARMIGDGSIRLAAPGRYWFDMTAHEAARASTARRRLPWFVVVPVLIAVIAMLLY